MIEMINQRTVVVKSTLGRIELSDQRIVVLPYVCTDVLT